MIPQPINNKDIAEHIDMAIANIKEDFAVPKVATEVAINMI